MLLVNYKVLIDLPKFPTFKFKDKAEETKQSGKGGVGEQKGAKAMSLKEFE